MGEYPVVGAFASNFVDNITRAFNDVDIVAGSTKVHVIAQTARQCIVACQTVDDIDRPGADQVIIACSSVDCVTHQRGQDHIDIGSSDRRCASQRGKLENGSARIAAI